MKTLWSLPAVALVVSMFTPGCSKDSPAGPTPAQIGASCMIVCNTTFKGCPTIAKAQSACEKVCGVDQKSLEKARACEQKATAAGANHCTVGADCLGIPK